MINVQQFISLKMEIRFISLLCLIVNWFNYHLWFLIFLTPLELLTCGGSKKAPPSLKYITHILLCLTVNWFFYHFWLLIFLSPLAFHSLKSITHMLLYLTVNWFFYHLWFLFFLSPLELLTDGGGGGGEQESAPKIKYVTHTQQ